MYLKLGIILVKNFTLLGLFFRTRQCTRLHRLGVQKRAKMEKRGCFWSYWHILERTYGKLRKTHAKNAYLGSIFLPEKYVFRVCFESPFTRMISSLKYKFPPGGLKWWFITSTSVRFFFFPEVHNKCWMTLLCTDINSLGSRREAFLSQNIRTCMCSFTFNSAFHQNSKVFSHNLALPLIYCWPNMSPNLFLLKCKQQHLDKLKEVKTPWVLVVASKGGHSMIEYLLRQLTKSNIF